MRVPGGIMSGLSVGEITYFFVIFTLSFIGLAVMLAILEILTLVTRRMLRRQLASTDLDLIGQEALVVKTIRPKKTGQIACRTPEGERIADAVSEEMIRRDSKVLITAADKDRFRVRPVRQDARPAKTADTETSHLAMDPSPTLIKSIQLMDQQESRPDRLASSAGGEAGGQAEAADLAKRITP